MCYSTYSSKYTDILVIEQLCSTSDAEDSVDANATCDDPAPRDK